MNRPERQRYKDHADDSNASARHELFHALRFGAGIVIAIALQQIDHTPHTETGTQGNDENLQHIDSLIEKFHKL